jgi:uncharacterized membrane protein YphA (DoxX/SURF4 family)
VTWRHANIAISWLLKLGLGIMFIVAGIAKLRDPSGFAEEIANYQLFPSLAPYLAASLPMVEIAVGAILVFGMRRSLWLQGAALCAALMMVVFTIGVSHVVVEGINIDCGCFGGNMGPVKGTTVVRDVFLSGAAATLLVLTRLSVDKVRRKSAS